MLINEIKQELKCEIWNVDTMALVIQAQKEKLSAKGREMTCLVVKTNCKGKDEFLELLENLKENISEYEGIRFQLACEEYYNDDHGHWFPMDIQIKNGCLHLIITDSIFNPQSTECIAKTTFSIFKDAIIYAYAPDQVLIDSKKQRRDIQKDKESCTRFTAKNIFRLQTRNLFDIFEQHQNTFKLTFGPDGKSNWYSINPENVPKEFAFFFKNSQSLSIIGTLNDDLKNHIINKKGETLLESIARHTEVISTVAKPIKKNMAIQHFKSKLVTQLDTFLSQKTENEVSDIIHNRTKSIFNNHEVLSCKKIDQIESLPILEAMLLKEFDSYLVIKKLLEKGVNINVINDNQQTPLSLAAENGHKEVVQLLLEQGADPNIKNKWGDNALMSAQKGNQKEIMMILLSHNTIKINESNNFGMTTLMKAVLGNQADVVEMLLAFGADPLQKSKQGKTALDFTDNEQIRFLLNKKANRSLVSK